MEEGETSHFGTTIFVIILVALWLLGGFNVSRGIALFFGDPINEPETNTASMTRTTKEPIPNGGTRLDPAIVKLYNETHKGGL